MKKETEEQLKKRLKEEVRKELEAEMNKPKSKKKVSKKGGQGSLVLLLVSAVLIVILVIFMPKIYKYFNRPTKSNYEEPTVPKVEEKIDKITKDSDILTKLVYPIMHNDIYSKESYYSNDSITMKEFTNNDILYNAFIHVYTGSIAEYNESYGNDSCVPNGYNKMFNANYIEARVNNLFGKSTEYTFDDFVVPGSNENTTYVGKWVYDQVNHRYIYYGNCDSRIPNDYLYYELLSMSNVDSIDSNNTIYIDYKLAFARVNRTNGEYTIYSDINYTNVISSGFLETDDYYTELNSIYKNTIVSDNELSTYKYTFSTDDCAYGDYCFVKGEWNNG